MKDMIEKLFFQKLFFWIPAIAALVGDLVSKSWAQDRLTEANLALNPAVTFFSEKRAVPFEGEPLIDGVLHLKWAENTGAAFSLGAGQTGLLLFLGLGVLGVLLIYVYRIPCKRWFMLLCLGLIAGGAIGNLYDRATYVAPDRADLAKFHSGLVDEVAPVPAVRDFLYWPFDIPIYSTYGVPESEIELGHTKKWPIFNIADMTIVGGVICLVGVLLFTKEEKKPAKKAKETDAAAGEV